jgi:hypothetical protein
LKIYTVQLWQLPQRTVGAGIYLGKGLVITAAHVASDYRIEVQIGDVTVPAKSVKRDGSIDLLLFSIDEQKLPADLQALRMPLCEKPPQDRAPVILAAPQGITRTSMLPSLTFSPAEQARWPTVLADVETDGKSGSGVFDAEGKCLHGILSAKISVNDNNTPKAIGTYFVPASVIRPFVSSAGGTAKGTAVGTSANGRPVGTPGSGRGSPENPY